MTKEDYDLKSIEEDDDYRENKALIANLKKVKITLKKILSNDLLT